VDDHNTTTTTGILDDPNTTPATLEADEEILTYTIADEAIEAAAGIERGKAASYLPPQSEPCLLQCLVWPG
jgi:hypothetical protein